ncbi:MAG: CoA-binding protein [Acidocella sp. 20-57-95]|nr:MAG: CoA-binding protein [Acidocella sp. 20-57-95]OYV58525.1 MAG: CoA-binding protein [Acidocella sp. 21-58-7]HQT64167.1 CoA-binding protein [Acidocella sp.]HQU04701.1 CoA-binding protein [Acidocella sp.]
MSDDLLRSILTNTKRIAVVGASNKPDRPSYEVMRFLISQGYEVTPVNPGLAGQSILGQAVVARLEEAGPLEMVDIFRNSADAAQPVADAIRLGAKTVWMQLGVVNEAAAASARAVGLNVVMNHCPAIEIPRLGLLK